MNPTCFVTAFPNTTTFQPRL